ncbi:MAG: hypothetical protein KGY69_10550 [Bacteroidales bacterium]|nr:hypothetical protein [Bacteroidales bacterium]
MPWRVSSWPAVYTTARRHEGTKERWSEGTRARKNDKARGHEGRREDGKRRKGEKEN